MTNETDSAGLIINIPFTEKNKIDSHFTCLSEKNLVKIYWLVDKISREKNYQINIRNHSDLLGWKTGELTNVISTLKNLNIIKLTEKYIKGQTSNKYCVIDGFNYKSDTTHKVFFYETQTTLPIWIRKYIADGYTVMSKKYTHYQPTINEPDLKIANQQQAQRILELEQELADLRVLIASGSHQPKQEIKVPVKSLDEDKDDKEYTFINEDLLDYAPEYKDRIKELMIEYNSNFKYKGIYVMYEKNKKTRTIDIIKIY